MKNPPLPKDWQEVKLKDIGEILGGGTPSTKNKEYWNGNILWLTPTEVTALKTKYLYDTERKITELGLKNSSAKMIKPNSLIICTRATIGDCCINKKEISTNQGFKSIIPNYNYDIVFLYYLISHNRNQLISNSSGSTFLEISKSNLENLSFYFPPLDEQKRIASVLSLCDEAIENLNKLIYKKELYKKGVMQRVLTGEKRFEGFTDEWKEIKLQNIVEEYSLPNTNRFKQYTIGKNGIKELDDFRHNIDKHKVFKKNDLIIGIGIDEINVNINLDCGCCSPVYKVYTINTNLLNPKFGYFYIRKGIERIKNKITRKSTRREFEFDHKEFIKHSIILPSLEEQNKIASFLSTIDEDIDNIKKLLELRKEQKKGLMQRLLTGEIRI